MKKCSKCKLLTDNFSRDLRHKDGLQSNCRSCTNKKSQKWREENIEKARMLDRIKSAKISGNPELATRKAEYDRLYRRTPKALKTARQKLLKKYWKHLTHEEAELEFEKIHSKQN